MTLLEAAVYLTMCHHLTTGGAGATAILIGPEAPLVVPPPPWQSTFASHCFDFCKPVGGPNHPVVDGPATQHWYMAAMDGCAAHMAHKLETAGVDMSGERDTSLAAEVITTSCVRASYGSGLG